MIVRDAMFMKYNGGAGAKFYNWSDPSQNAGYDSLFAVLALHCEQQEKFLHDPIDLSGKFLSSSALAPLQPKNGSTDADMYLTAGYYAEKFARAGSGMSDGKFDADTATNDAGDRAFYIDNPINRICYQGLQANRGASNEFDRFIVNTGHLVSFS